MNDSIMYWKWCDKNLEHGDITRCVEDLTKRTEIGSIFIGHHWCSGSFFGEKLQSALKKTGELLHAKKRKMVVECCYRNDCENFHSLYENEKAHLVNLWEIPLDENGKGEIKIEAEIVWHYWHLLPAGEFKFFGGWSADLIKSEYENLSILSENDFNIEKITEKEDGNEKVYLKISCLLKNQKNKTAIAAIGFPQPIPDPASKNYEKHITAMVKKAKEAGADGVFSDEWGYDVILKIRKPNPYDDNQLNMEYHSYSPNFDEFYEKINGKKLLPDLIHLRYAKKGDSSYRRQIINNYLKAFRALMKFNDDVLYDVAKKEIGKDAFVGVHPTWWGSVDSLNFEVHKNAFYWWEAKRDYAQTDETVIMPIRLALSRKWTKDIWYNMWYSMGTRDINTYYVESWNNLRYGGRTHYLGYECPNESVVLELYPQGLLESIEEMDKRIRLMDGKQKQPDSRVLMVFGYEATLNWANMGKPLPPWLPQNVRLDKVLNTANKLFANCLIDLVPSSEIDGGSLTVKDGKAVYGSKTYDACIFLYPSDLTEKSVQFIESLNKDRLILAVDEDKAEAVIIERNKAKGVKIFNEIPKETELAICLKEMGVEFNRVENGVKNVDGSWVFTGDGKKNIGNSLFVSETINGKKIEFTGEDFLYVSSDLSSFVFPKGEIKIDGVKLK